jgi:hypothetical protein
MFDDHRATPRIYTVFFAFIRLEILPSFPILRDSASKFAPAFYRTTLR